MKSLIKKLRAEWKYLLIARAQQSLDLLGVRKSRRLFLPELATELPQGPVLCLAPHPDDETLCSGGALHLLSKAGRIVHVVVLTDGSEGLPGEGGVRRAAQRREEVANACKILEVNAPIHLNFPDGQLSPNHETVETVKNTLLELAPKTVFIPFPIDYHGDHTSTVSVFLKAAEMTDRDYDIWCAESSCPHYPNVIVDITSCIEVKKAAIAAHVSQNAANDYVWTIAEGFNKFRSFGLLKGQGYAEGFFRTDLKYLRCLLDNLLGI